MASFNIPSQKVQPGSLPGSRISADALGYGRAAEAVNDAVQGFAAEYERQSLLDQKDTDDNRVMDAMNLSNQRGREGMYGEGGIMTMRGSNAAGSYAKTKQLMMDIKEEATQGLENDDQRRAFDRQFYSYENRMYNSSIQWEEKQRQVDRNDTMEARRYNAIQGAADSAADPYGMAQSDQENQELYQKNLATMSQERAQMQLEKDRALSRSVRLKRLAELDPIKAHKFYEAEQGSFGEYADEADKIAKGAITGFAKNAVVKASEACAAAGRDPIQCGKEEARRGSQNNAYIPQSNFTTSDGQRVDLDDAVAKSGATHVPANLLYTTAAVETRGKFNDATSPAGAQGHFQFMPATANDYRSRYGDFDVHNPEQAAVMAARYHEDTYSLFKTRFDKSITDPRIFGAAYNCGRGCVSSAVRKAGSTEYDDFEQYLPDETREYGRLMAEYSGTTEPMSPDFTAAFEAGNKEGLALIQGRESMYNMQPSDPAAKKAYSAARGAYMTNPQEFAKTPDAQIREEQDGKLPPSMIDELINDKNAMKGDVKYSKALSDSTSIMRQNGMYLPGPTADMEDEDVQNQVNSYYAFENAVHAEVRIAQAANGDIPLTMEQNRAIVEKMFVDVKFVEIEAGFFGGKDTKEVEYYQLAGMGTPTGYTLDITDVERGSARAAWLKKKGRQPTTKELFDIVMLQRGSR